MKYFYFGFGLSIFFMIPVFAVQFTDIDASMYRDSIETLASDQIIAGYPDQAFRPDQPINRAEFLKILLESKFPVAIELFQNNNQQCFSDMSTDDVWYKSYACVVKDLQIIAGYPDGTFRPADTINKAEAAKILHNVYFENIESATSPWYEAYYDELKSRDIFLQLFSQLPESPLTRGEMAFAIDQFNNYPRHILQPVFIETEIIPVETETETETEAEVEEEKEIVMENNKNEVSPLFVITSQHPGNKVTGGYISNYNQWQRAKFAPDVQNYINTDDNERMAREVFDSVNAYRQSSGEVPMNYDADLQELAQNFAGHLVINAIYSHSDMLGQDPFERAKIAGISGFVAESMVWRKQSPAQAIDWWKNSALHVKNITNDRFTRAGVGVVQEPNGGYMVILLQGE